MQCPADPTVEEMLHGLRRGRQLHAPSDAHGRFSTVFGTPSTAGHTIGPFDPIYPFDTMLSDGKVDAGDAPMPAAQIDVTIKDNDPTDKTDISGVGYLFPSWKTEVYSRDGKGGNIWNGDENSPIMAHNFYAPFYSQYIPATSRPAAPARLVRPTAPSRRERHRRLRHQTGSVGSSRSGEYRNWGFAWTSSFRLRRLQVPVLAGPAGSRTSASGRCRTAQLRLGLHRRER